MPTLFPYLQSFLAPIFYIFFEKPMLIVFVLLVSLLSRRFFLWIGTRPNEMLSCIPSL